MRLVVSTKINADAESVWRFVADFSNDPTWRDAVSEMTPTPSGPAHVGQSIREVLTFQGTTYITDTRVRETGVRSLSFDGNGEGTRVRGARTVTEAAPGVSRFTQELSIRLRGPKRLIEPVMAVLYRRLMQDDLSRLRRLVEGEGSTPSPVSRHGE